jgi:hypothetical protein
MRSRPEGTRNNSLFIYARELLRCGAKTSGLREAALVAGRLSDATIGRAEADVAMLLSPSVLTKVKT